MNNVCLSGRLTRDPNVNKAQKQDGTASVIAHFTVAVDRRGAKKDEGQQSADFIPCTAFGRTAEFVEKYLKQGTKINLVGEIRTGSYTNKEGQKVYTVEVVANNCEFAESKAASATASANTNTSTSVADDNFVGGDDEDAIPFN